MKKVLIIARYFGTRIPGLLKYLPEFGWQPVLLITALPEGIHPLPDVSIIAAGSRVESYLTPASGRSILDRILACGGEIINYPDSYKAWRKPAIKAGGEILRREKPDAIISSSAPVTGHIIARELKKTYDIPWLADLRDLWSQNHNYYYSPLRRMFDRRLERRTLSAADALVTVSPLWADRLNSLHQDRAVYTVTNGFDPAMADAAHVRLSSKFTITYTGNIYGGKQSPARLFTSLRNLISEGIINPGDVEVRFYGSRLAWLEKEINKSGLSGIVRQYGLVSPQAALEKQKESQLLWLLDWDDPAENGWYPLKVFEYLGTRRPVLATGGVTGNAVDTLLSETKGGVHAVTTDSITDSLKDYYKEYRQHGKISCHGLEAEINRYTHREMTAKFVAILNGLVEH